MSSLLLILLILTLGIGPVSALAADGEPPTQEQVRGAIGKSLPLIVKGATGYTEQRDCFSCHHQAVPILALTLGKPRKLGVDEEALREQVTYTDDALTGAVPSYRKGEGLGGGVTTAGYLLWTLELGGRTPDELTTAVAEYLLRRNEKKGFWEGTGARPPSEGSRFTSTYVALRGLRAFASPEQRDRVAAREAAAREWLLNTPADDTEGRVFRLWALKVVEAKDDAIKEAASALLATQREDGGWSQVPDRSADAYATGSSLVALHETGALKVDDPAYRKGLSFLIASQEADGSWHVKSRSRPFQTYFESGFPHGKDQFISMAGSSWATAALILAIK